MKNVASPAEWHGVAAIILRRIERQATELCFIDISTFNAEHEKFVQSLQDLAAINERMSAVLERDKR